MNQIKTIFLFLFFISFTSNVFSGSLEGNYFHTPSSRIISITTWNTGDSDGKKPSDTELFQVMKNNNILSDLILLQEISMKSLNYLKEKGGYQFSAHSDTFSKKKYKIGLISRFKIQKAELIKFKEKNSGALFSEILVNGRILKISSVHFDYIRHKPRTKSGYVKVFKKENIKTIIDEIFKKNVRRDEAEILLKKMGKPGKATVIGGDFNTITASSSIRYILKYYDDAMFFKKDMFKGTYKKIDSFIKPKIDFIFHSEDMVSVYAKVTGDTPGDHYPVTAVFKFKN